MIIEFGFSSKGNGQVRVYNDRRTESFTILTHNTLPYTHSQNHREIWHLTDKEKFKIESEIRDYTRKFGTDQQKLIVFGKVSFQANKN